MGGENEGKEGACLEEFSFAVFPLAAFAFGEPALVAFLAGLAVFLLSEAAFLGLGEDFGGGMVEVSGLRDGGGDAFFEELYDFDRTFIRVVGRGDLEGVSDFERGAGFESVAGPFDLAGGAIVRCFAAGFIEADGPEPFINSHEIWEVWREAE